jgi:N utilization substance protein B
MSRRSRARETVLQMLFQKDLNADVSAEMIRAQIQERLEDEESARFAWRLFCGVMEGRPAIDAQIEQAAVNWTLRRMAPTDRNIIRLAVFEMQNTETPARVAIDEALELAKKFGSISSSQFVNGVLDRLMPGKPGSGERATLPPREARPEHSTPEATPHEDLPHEEPPPDAPPPDADPEPAR